MASKLNILLLLVIAVTMVAAGKNKAKYRGGKPVNGGNLKHGSHSKTEAQRENKRGACPALIDAIAGTCDEGCTGDSDCDDNMKCCDNGCGHGCFLPVAENRCHIACTREYSPVCGTDGVTYSNPCMLRYRKCNTNQKFIEQKHFGQCRGDEEEEDVNTHEQVGPCSRELRQVRGPMRIPMIGQKIPQCDENGYYLPMQCSGSTGTCECVNKEAGFAFGRVCASWTRNLRKRQIWTHRKSQSKWLKGPRNY